MTLFFLANRKYFCQILTQLFCSCSKIGRYEVSQGIKARKSLYENNQQSETTQDQRRDSVSKAPKETEVVTKKQKYIVEKKEVEEEKTENKAKDKKERNSSQQGKKQSTYFDRLSSEWNLQLRLLSRWYRNFPS